MRRACKAAILILCLTGYLSAADDGWVEMFDGESLSGWKANERPENWKVEDGAIVGRGERSHLFWMEQKCVDCEFKAEVKVNDGGNSGMYFRAKFMEGWPDGYEAQVNSTHTDPVRTGSLYNHVEVRKQLVPPNEWFTQHIIVRGNRIQIFVNGEKTVDYRDDEDPFSEGYLALQQHDPGSVVHYRDLMFKDLQ